MEKDTLYNSFLAYLSQESLIPNKASTLLALSGGLDSMVMLNLFYKAKLPCGVAHCNFLLRGEDSEQDEKLVHKIADSLGLPFFSVRFDTQKIAKEEGVSIQVAARNLRYEWLEKIRIENDYQLIATAHHLNDTLETQFYNLIKGCGIRGLQGIPVKNDCVIRPLSFAKRETLETYQREHHVAFRKDASNNETKYSRNKIRHQVIPVLKTLNPALENTMIENAQRFKETEYLFRMALEAIKSKAWTELEQGGALDLNVLRQHFPALPTILFEFLQPYGINNKQSGQLSQSIDAKRTGAIYYTEKFRFLIDRDQLLIEPKDQSDQSITYTIREKDQELKVSDGTFYIKNQKGQPASFPQRETQVFLDASCIKFPLVVRHWQEGDVFQPLGMGGQHQKVKDFFNNNKISRFLKERIWIVEDDQQRICWIVGYRLDNRLRITKDTSAYWIFDFENNISHQS